MARKRSKQHLAVACQPAGSLGILSVLDEGSLLEVLRAAKEARVLGRLASTCRQLCTLARSGVQCCLWVLNTGRAHLLMLLHARGGPQFTGCTELHLAARNPTECLLVAGILSTVQHWPSLEKVWLAVRLQAAALGPGQSLDFCGSSLVAAASALRQLRHLDLTLPDLGPCSAGYIGRMVQLTRLELSLSSSAAAGTAAAAGTRVDLTSWSCLTNLKRLHIVCGPAVQPAAGTRGPGCLPSSLTFLSLAFGGESHPDPLACWLTHLPGCPQLEELDVVYGPQQHASTHPRAIVRLSLQHNPRLRKLHCWHNGNDMQPVWGATVAGLPDAAGPVDQEWHPGPALAALKGLEELTGEHLLTVREAPHWQHLVQLTALTELYWAAFHYAPHLQAGATLGVLELEDCHIHLCGRGMGCLLMACPQLYTADLTVSAPVVLTPVGPSEALLEPHPNLKTLMLRDCHSWSSAAAAAPGAPPAAAAAAGAGAGGAAAVGATAHFNALAPVLKGLIALHLFDWPASSSSSPAVGTLPDLSSCTALTQLEFSCHEGGPNEGHPEQEQFLSMVRPLVTLQRLEVQDAPRLNARVVLVAQSLLPQLQRVLLRNCGRQLPLMPSGSQRQQVERALHGVKQLLRPGLELYVVG